MLTQKERMSIVVDAMKWTQRELGEILSMSGTAAWKIINGDTVIKEKHARPISEASGYNLLWLLTGEGAMKDELSMLAEPDINYGPMINTKDSSLQKKFDSAIGHIMALHHLTQYKEVADLLKVDYDHMNAVRGGHRPLTMKLLIHAGKYGGISANNILFDIEPVMLADVNKQNRQIESLRQRVEELKRDKENMQLTIDSLIGKSTVKQTA